MREMRCAECGYDELASSVEAFIEEGWMFVTTLNGELGWICPTCAKKHEVIIKHIQERYFGTNRA